MWRDISTFKSSFIDLGVLYSNHSKDAWVLWLTKGTLVIVKGRPTYSSNTAIMLEISLVNNTKIGIISQNSASCRAEFY